MTESRLTLTATVFHLLSVASLFLFPVVMMIGLFSPETFGNFVATYTELPQAEWPISVWFGIAVGLIPFVFAMLALNGMRKLFALYKLGDPLAPKAVLFIREIGKYLLAAALLGVAVQPAKSALMSMSNAEGERFVSIGITNSDVGFILVAGLLLLIGWSMSEAQRLAAENREFV